MNEAPQVCCATQGADGNDILHVLTKRTYRITPTGSCRPAETQVPLLVEPVDYDRRGQGGAAPPKMESDAMCNGKPGTDVVLQGRAHALRGPRPWVDVAVAVTSSSSPEAAWRNARRLRVWGERHVERTVDGNLHFSPPEPFESMDLSYDRAYGGRDVWAEAKNPDPMIEFNRHYSDGQPMQSRYAYPRNPAGRGYLIEATVDALAELKLPNVEDPNDLLTPERLCVGDVRRWHLAPAPAGLDWIDLSWFPRLGLLGLFPEFDGRPEDLPEVQRGYLSADAVRASDDSLAPPALLADTNGRFFHGASPGLCLPTLRGTESILISGMHPSEPVFQIRMAGERPRIFIDPPIGAKAELLAALRTVAVDLEERTMITVWEARLPMDRPLTEKQKQQIRYAARWS